MVCEVHFHKRTILTRHHAMTHSHSLDKINRYPSHIHRACSYEVILQPSLTSNCLSRHHVIVEDICCEHVIQGAFKDHNRQIDRRQVRSIPQVDVWILMELCAYRAYKNPELDISFWRTSTGFECDFILGNMNVAVEVKGAARVHRGHTRGLKALIQEHKGARPVIVSLEKEPRTIENTIEAMPWELFLILFMVKKMNQFYLLQPSLLKKSKTLEKAYQKHQITQREQEIIRLICRGKTNREIEDILFISLQTVKNNIYRIFKKLSVKNRVELINFVRLHTSSVD